MKKMQFTKIIFKAEDRNGYLRRFSFIGKWIFQNKQCSEDKESRHGTRYSFAITKNKGIFMLRYNNGQLPYYDDFHNFDEIIEADYVPVEIIKMVADSKYFIEELNI